MDSVGIRELKNNTSSVVRKVREDGAEFLVTLHGEAVAILRPLDQEERDRLARAARLRELDDLDEFAERVSQAWRSAKSPVEMVDDQRR